MTQETHALAELIQAEKSNLLAEWRRRLRTLLTARDLDTPTLNDHIPGFLDELITALLTNVDDSVPEAHFGGTPPTHGRQRFADGFAIEEVVGEYNILRQTIHDFACDHGLALQGSPFRTLNRIIDEAIASAVRTYTFQQNLHTKQRREEYLAFVAHDLRTPLNAISFAAQELESTLERERDPAYERKMLRALHRNVHRLSSLVSKVLDENNSVDDDAAVKVERRVLDLWSLVESVNRELFPIAKSAGTRLSNDVPEDLEAYADAELLRRVLQNLVANALRYAPGGNVIVAARSLDDLGSVECTVVDDGVGIPASQIDKVFDKNTSDGTEGGRGLGLAIFKTFVEAHDGTVAVESIEGKGATFRFTLPKRA